MQIGCVSEEKEWRKSGMFVHVRLLHLRLTIRKKASTAGQVPVEEIFEDNRTVHIQEVSAAFLPFARWGELAYGSKSHSL